MEIEVEKANVDMPTTNSLTQKVNNEKRNSMEEFTHFM